MGKKKLLSFLIVVAIARAATISRLTMRPHQIKFKFSLCFYRALHYYEAPATLHPHISPLRSMPGGFIRLLLFLILILY